MNNHDMQSKTSPRSGTPTLINSHTNNGNQFNLTSTVTLGSQLRKEKTGSIFSFLQRFRVKNRDLFNEGISLPCSSRLTRYNITHQTRWESIESVLSSATASSFAFIPNTTPKQKAAIPENSSNRSGNCNASTADNAVFLRRKYNLHGSDVSLYPNESQLKKQTLKKLYRKSVGDAANLKIDDWSITIKHGKDTDWIYLPKSKSSLIEANKTSRCHRPGKRRAPPPPNKTSLEGNTPIVRTARSTLQKEKRRAPSFPSQIKMENEMKTDVGQPANGVIIENVSENGTRSVCNDYLKLERGQLKANKSSTLTTCASLSSIYSKIGNSLVPVSPRPWYKRNLHKTLKKSTLRSSDKHTTCDELLDEWMLEADLSRSSFKQKSCNEKQNDTEIKRRSYISMLANISELDREAAEIIRQERKTEQELADSLDNKYYDHIAGCQVIETAGNQTSYQSNGFTSAEPQPTTRKRTHTKDFISISNAFTNMTKITVNAKDGDFGRSSSFNKFSMQEDSIPRHMNSRMSLKSSTRCSELKITDKKDSKKEKGKTDQQENRKLDNELKPKITSCIDSDIKLSEPGVIKELILQPIKPFSSWVCPDCTLENPSWKFICEACNKWRPYSVSKLSKQQSLIASSKENTKLVQCAITEENEEIKKISENIHKQAYDNLTSVENVRNDFAKLELSNNKKMLEKEGLENRSKDIADPINNCSVLRNVRTAFYSKNLLNDLNRDDEITFLSENFEKSKIEKKTQKYYNEEDRKKLSEILKELKDSLLKDESLEKEKFTKPNNDTSLKDYPVSKNGIFKSSSTQIFVKSKLISEDGKSKSNIDPDREIFEKAIGKNLAAQKYFKEGNQNINMNESIPLECLPVDNTNIQHVSMSSAEGSIKNNGLKPRSNCKQFLNSSSIPSSSSKENYNVTNFVIISLLKKLQISIANGQHHDAANIARELARLKVNCSMKHEMQDSLQTESFPQNFIVNCHIEKDTVHQTSFLLNSYVTLPLLELKKKIANEFNIPIQRQLWMYKNIFLSNESTILKEIGLTTTNIFDVFLDSETDIKPAFLNDVAVNDSDKLLKNTYQPNGMKNKNEKNEANSSQSQVIAPTDSNKDSEWKCLYCTLINSIQDERCVACGHAIGEYVSNLSDAIDSNVTLSQSQNHDCSQNINKLANYQQLVDMEKSLFIPNTEKFECSICLLEYQEGEGVVLKECLHTFCKECIQQTVQHSTEAEVKCPFRDDNYSCECTLQEREIKALVTSEIFEQHLIRSIKEAENRIKNTFHCKTVNCQGWCIFEDNVNEFHCPVCNNTNCLTCQIIHFGLNCKQYQEIINKESETNGDANRTRLMLQEMLQKGEAMTCPTCQIIVMKKWGCDWLRCSMCKTEICWITRGPRWGPNGKGDNSAGCRCGVRGVKCHPQCTYCH